MPEHSKSKSKTKSQCKKPNRWIPENSKHKSYCHVKSNPKTQEKCNKRHMEWIEGIPGERDSYCRKKTKPRKVSRATCEKRSHKWVKSTSKRRGYCRRPSVKK